MTLLNPDDVKFIVLHCSASAWGNAEEFDRWHKQRGWSGIGYHYVITNCYPTYTALNERMPVVQSDGVVEVGRSEQFRGAHVRGHNWESIGICLVGSEGIFTAKQLESAVELCYDLSLRFPRRPSIKGHYEFTDQKTCPDINMDYFRSQLMLLGG